MKFTRSAAGLAAVAALLLVGGIAYASIPAPDGTINGCRKNSDGSLRVVDSAASCPSGWTALNWSQTGPQGPAGPVGVSGYGVVENGGPLEPNTSYGDPGITSNSVSCPAGKVALGGGAYAPTESDGTVWALVRSAPLTDGTQAVGWQAIAVRQASGPHTSGGNLLVYAICATVN